MGVSHSYVSHIENNSRAPSLKIIQKVSDALEVPVYVLMMVSLDPSCVDKKEEKHFRGILKRWLDI